MARFPIIAVLLALAGEVRACTPLRLGYVDQHRPPFFLGSGKSAPEAPGVSVELIREAAAQAGCTVELVRLPHARLRTELAAGRIDAAPIDARSNDTERFAYPLDPSGLPDRSFGMPLLSVVYVRAGQAAPDSDPAAYLKGRRMGVLAGTPYGDDYRAMGIQVDDGALDVQRNLEKLARKRIDGFAIIVATPSDLDQYVAKHYGQQLVRLEKPIRVASMWITFNRDYYTANRTQVEAMWAWSGARLRTRLPVLLKKYEQISAGSP